MLTIENPVLYNIWKDRYCKNGESLQDNLRRVAHYLARDTDEEEEFYNVMNNGYFFPAGRTMSNAGIGEQLGLSNCYTLNFVENSMEGIFDAVKMAALTHKSGGGTGFNFSLLSPKGKVTHNNTVASGPVSFMDVFNAQTATITSGSRRGANMGVLSVYHPDIVEFIEAKSQDANRLQHFNLSVLVDDDFMNAVENDSTIKLHWPVFDDYGNMTPEEEWDSTFTKEVSAVELWNKIMEYTYNYSEPGVLISSTMNTLNPASYVETIVGTNPLTNK